MTIVHVREKAPPTDTERLEWFLLTTLPVENADDAERILSWYQQFPLRLETLGKYGA